jgi:uncharacterized protein (DUF1499 family)
MAPHRIDFATLIRPSKPNTFLLAPEGLCKKAKVDKAAPIYPVTAAKLRQEFLAVAIARPRVSHTFADEARLYDDFVARSALLGFPDHVSVKFLDVQGGKSTLAVYSRSVYGRSDLGVNRARILSWLAGVNGAIKPQSP